MLLILSLTILLFSCQTSPQNQQIVEQEYSYRIELPEQDYDCNLLDYFPWRGDLTFEQSPLNEIDYAIFAQISYNNFNGIVNGDTLDINHSEQKKLCQVAKEFEESADFETRKYNGPLINENTSTLLKLASLSNRFSQVKLCAFVDELDEKKGMQFSAYTAILDDKTAIITYRGTYTEIVGWQEDFDMAYKFPVLAQTRAVEYLEEVSSFLPHNIILLGHSKGGNLAMYAGAYCKDSVKKRIVKICNLDGQGFSKEIIGNKNFASINQKLVTFLPQASVVGMLFYRNGDTVMVESNEKDILYQHDMFSWKILGNKFVRANTRSEKSIKIEKEMKELLDGMENSELEKFVKGVFGIFDIAEAKTLQDFQNNWIKKSGDILTYMNTLDKQTKDNLWKLIKILT